MNEIVVAGLVGTQKKGEVDSEPEGVRSVVYCEGRVDDHDAHHYHLAQNRRSVDLSGPISKAYVAASSARQDHSHPQELYTVRYRKSHHIKN